MPTAFTNERTKARSFTTRAWRMQGPRAPVSPVDGGDGILLRRRVDSEADKATLMALLDDKRIAHSFGTCVPIFQGGHISAMIFRVSLFSLSQNN